MYLRKFLSVFFFLALPLFSYAQISNLRCKTIVVDSDSLTLDSLTVFPGSVKLQEPDSTLSYYYDVNLGKLILSADDVKRPDSLMICYRVMPFSLTDRFYNRDLALYDSSRSYREEGRYAGYRIAEREEIFSAPGLNKSGSVTRGISFGNNQNVFVNSALNLQMDGKLSDDIGITAVISDQNIPFQPEGNTRQLQEFDRVYIQLHSEKANIIAGDLVMKDRPGHFLKYYRNVQGGQAEVRMQKDSNNYSVTTLGAAVSKGKFASTFIEPVEGVQGPYRLRGPNNERFIIILANSEKVYVDGKLMTRGFDYDYTIDYNLAELTFTNNILITRFSVVRVDFEFSERNYGRANINAGHYQHFKRGEVYVNYYLQRDNPNNPLLFSLRNDDRAHLSEIGDDLSLAVISGIDSVGYQENRVLYRQIDSAGVVYYEHTTDPRLAFYEVTFTNVGPGAGAYRLLNTTTNGRIFRFVGAGAGDHLPVRAIPTPQKNQMITLGGNLKLSPNDRLFAEFAISEHDKNLYSKLDAHDDQGKAMRVGYHNDGFYLPILKKFKFFGGVDYEFTEMHFNEIDRFRDINFERDWSADAAVRGDNQMLNMFFGFDQNIRNNFVYRMSRRIKSNDVNGMQQTFELNRSAGRLQLSAKGFWMFNDRTATYSDWKRLSLNTSYLGKLLVPGIEYSTDKNTVVNEIGEVTSSAMYFEELKVFTRTNDSLKFKVYFDYAVRSDKIAQDGQMRPFTNSRTLNSGFNATLFENHNISTGLTYRYLENVDNANSAFADEETVLGRFDWHSDLLSRHIRSELTVTTGTGRELKREYFYQAVPQGTGTHIWNDFNSDSIQDLNEFVEKVPGLAYNQQEFIRIFLPTDEYVKAYTGSFNYRLDLVAPRHWRDSESFLKSFLSRFSSLASWNVTRKLLDPDLFRRFGTGMSGEDDDVLSAQKMMRATLFFNRTNPLYGMDLQFASSDNKALMMQGSEGRTNQELKYSGRVNIKQLSSIKLVLARGTRGTSSDFLALRNYLIRSYSFLPEIAFQPKSNLRFASISGYTVRTNILHGAAGELAKLYETGIDFRYNTVSQRTLSGNLRFIRIFTDFKDTPLNSPLGYDMLEALQKGNNFTWNISWQEKLVNGLQISIIYEGRRSENSRVIHTGRMQASAFF